MPFAYSIAGFATLRFFATLREAEALISRKPACRQTGPRRTNTKEAKRKLIRCSKTLSILLCKTLFPVFIWFKYCKHVFTDIHKYFNDHMLFSIYDFAIQTLSYRWRRLIPEKTGNQTLLIGSFNFDKWYKCIPDKHAFHNTLSKYHYPAL